MSKSLTVGDRVEIVSTPFGAVGFIGRLEEIDYDDVLQPYRVILDNGHIVWTTQVRPIPTPPAKRGCARVLALGTAVVAALTLSVVLAPSADAPPTGLEAGRFIRSEGPVTSYKPTPEPRPSTNSRDGDRPELKPSENVARQRDGVEGRRIPVPPADIRVSFYKDCTGHAQSCIDDGHLTMYGGKILAGHNYMGYQWLSRVPVGREVRVISGPLAGTYRIYGHMKLNRQGGVIPDFGSADLVLQSCEGSGTGFSLARLVNNR